MLLPHAMFERTDGQYQLSMKFPVDIAERLRDLADREHRSVNAECVVRLQQSLAESEENVGKNEHPWKGETETLTIIVRNDEIAEYLLNIDNDSDIDHSADQEAKYRIIDTLADYSITPEQ